MARTDKDCAQTLISAAIASRGDQNTAKTLIENNLTHDEMARGAAYIQSGQPVTGPSNNTR